MYLCVGALRVMMCLCCCELIPFFYLNKKEKKKTGRAGGVGVGGLASEVTCLI
jgi:hypothetical protein